MKRATFVITPLLLGLGFVMAYAGEGAILFSDDFATLDPGWGEASEQTRVEGKKMLVLPKVNMSYTNLYQGNLFGDVDIRVKVAQTSGASDRPGSLVFWGNNYDSFYSVDLVTDGRVGVSRKVSQGRWLTPVEWKLRPAAKKGLNQENELRVVTKGNTATVYVNGEQIANLKGIPPEGGSLVGLCAESGAEQYVWTFSDFSVRKAE